MEHPNVSIITRTRDRGPVQRVRIWPGQDLTPGRLQAQWEQEFRHEASASGLAQQALAASGWEAWESHVQEAFSLNRRWMPAPHVMRHLFLPQGAVNLHLLEAAGLMLQAWQYWVQLPHVRNLPGFPPASERVFLLLSARSQLEQAGKRADSLRHRGRLVHHFSVRQRRYYQYMAGLFADLEPLVRAAPGPAGGGADQLKRDIASQTRELRLLAGGLEHKPRLAGRCRLPRLEVNRLLAATCLHHHAFLKGMVHFQEV